VPPTLIITNDFPPTVGGIEAFVAELCRLLDGRVIVLTRHAPGWSAYDARQPFPVVRHGSLLLPTPAAVRRAVGLVRAHGITRVIFGAMAPLALMADALRSAGVERMLAISHGHETWWATLPGSAALLRRMADGVDHVSVISDYTRRRIAPALSPAARQRIIRLAPPVDLDRFQPAPDGERDQQIGRARCIAVGRMVRQKGFDRLLAAWPTVVDRLAGPSPDRPGPAPELVLVGDGPQAPALRRAVARTGLTGSVRFTGPLTPDGVAAVLRTATVFALPVRTRLAGLNPEGLGLGFLEAAASGLPVIAGRSGGAAETVLPGRTGFVVDPDEPVALGMRIAELLADPDRARRMGLAGRAYVAERYGSPVARRILAQVLGSDGQPPDRAGQGH
jgi:phosphatidylinositol alpha-1,6-mannosyltransferase